MGKTQFDKNWLQQTDANGTLFGSYIIVDDKVNNAVYCKVCNRKKICFENRGFIALKDHAKSTKHQDLLKLFDDTKQLRLTPSESSKILSKSSQNNVSNQDELFTISPKPSTSKETQQAQLRLHITDGDIIKKEITWVIHSVMKHSSFHAAEKDSNVLKIIAPNDLRGFSLYRQKMTDMVNEAIGPYFRELFLKDVRGEYFSFLFDETEGNNKRKELEITIKYFSKRLQTLMFFHLDSVFLGKATADIMLEKILQSLEKAKLPLANLVMVGRDGPKVNQSLERKINSKLVGERGFELVNIGSCPAHIVHNGIKYALKEYGSEVSELAKVVYYYFEVPARWDQFVTDSKCKPKKFVKFVDTRWVQLGSAASVLLENYSQLMLLKTKLARMEEKRLTFHEKVPKDLLIKARFARQAHAAKQELKKGEKRINEEKKKEKLIEEK
ncbi:uncharacterized protein LOC134209712 [Armigeres subalbatus]|uniref:uncharacterized protein LOC134209712 n=1 Tax=Armigeres subalbatus TaxID=124917 RepID=UPI002ED3E47D